MQWMLYVIVIDVDVDVDAGKIVQTADGGLIMRENTANRKREGREAKQSKTSSYGTRHSGSGSSSSSPTTAGEHELLLDLLLLLALPLRCLRSLRCL